VEDFLYTAYGIKNQNDSINTNQITEPKQKRLRPDLSGKIKDSRNDVEEYYYYEEYAYFELCDKMIP
jgi:hypothetical protein